MSADRPPDRTGAATGPLRAGQIIGQSRVALVSMEVEAASHR
jgi:hypothetical protein